MSMHNWTSWKKRMYKEILDVLENRKVVSKKFLLATIRVELGLGKEKSEEMYRDLLDAERIEEVKTETETYVILYGTKDKLIKEGILLSKTLDKKEKKEE